MARGPTKALFAAAAALWSAAAAAQPAWPARPIHIVCPLPAGSASDTVARLIGARLSERLGQTVLIDNRDGGSGVIGTSQIARAEPDGYTLGLATTTTLVTAPVLDKRVPYKPTADFTAVAMIGYSAYVLAAHPGLGARTVADFVKLAKSKPGGLTYSTVGDSSLARLQGELFGSLSGVSLTQVPYKSSTQAVIDLLAGRIDSQFGILATTQQYFAEGKLNALGVTSLERVKDFPDIPTIAESGLPGFESTLWIGLIAPAGLDAAVARRLNEAVNASLAEPATAKTLRDLSIVVDAGKPEGLSRRVASDIDKWGALAAKAGL
jgi:tripartite-type tricarboxylate transporter receptor subunit TctC